MNLDLIKEIIVVAVASSVISTAAIQKIKEFLKEFTKSKTILYVIAFLISGAVGFLFSLTFSDLNAIGSIWVGVITWVGADAVYKAFEDKIFTSFSDMNNDKEIEISRDDE